MARIRAHDSTAILRILKKEFDEVAQRRISNAPKRILKNIGKDIIEEMKSGIAKGISPVGSIGRFAAYKNPSRYPGPEGGSIRRKYPQKRNRPVNLYLSGDFLDKLDVDVKQDFFGKAKIFIGFFDEKSILKEKGHAEGQNGQPKRPIIPNKLSDFSRLMARKIVEIVHERMKPIFKEK